MIKELVMQEKVKCLICNREFDYILAPAHLKTHQLTLKEYKEMYPDAVLITSEYIEKQKRSHDPHRKNPILPKQVETKPGIVVEKKLVFKSEEKPKESKPIAYAVCNPKKENKKNILEDKEFIIEYLGERFIGNKVINNYFIESWTLSGYMSYRLISDIAIPSLKLDFEFPNAFWHNLDRPKQVRDSILEKDGWTVITVEDKNPTVQSIEKQLKKFLLEID